MLKLNTEKIIESLVLFLILLSVVYLFISGNMKLLINPRYNAFMIISIVILLIFIFISAKSIPAKKKIPPVYPVVKYIPFLVIIILTFIPSYSQFQNKITSIKGVQIGDSTAYHENQKESVSEKIEKTVTIKKIKNSVVSLDSLGKENTSTDTTGNTLIFNDKNFLSLIDSVYEKPKTHINKKIKITGFIYRVKSKGKVFAISRMAMICCAADSTPVGFICKKNGIKHDFKDNDWYTLEGKLKYESVKFGERYRDLPVIYISKFKKIKKLNSPYVHPDYGE